MTFSKYLQETRPLFLSLQILNIYELNTYMYLMALFMHSYFSGHLPNMVTNYFSKNSSIHEHSSRSANNLYMIYRSTKLLEILH